MPDIPALVGELAQALLARGWQLATAESCTGGLIAGACTEIAGSSAWFERGFVSYSNQAKSEMLGVDAALIAAHGAVSEAVARAMAHGAVVHSAAQCSLAVTGVAGPDGGTPAKPAGTVWFGWCVNGQTQAECIQFSGGRAAVRQATLQHALAGLLQRLRSSS